MKEENESASGFPPGSLERRAFLKMSGGLAMSGLLAPFLLVDTEGAQLAIPASEGYLLVDTKKCQGCLSCMLACSLIHEGQASLSLARIQVLQNSFAQWPDDVAIEQCRQCVDPECVANCPTGALAVDPKQGHVRRIDPQKCIGCRTCLKVCPFRPWRVSVVPDQAKKAGLHAAKCDLCAGASFHWDDGGGGPKGKQACVEVCPVGAIKFTDQIPKQEGEAGYKVNLRDKNWGKLGYPTD
jgi:protein NrfC